MVLCEGTLKVLKEIVEHTSTNRSICQYHCNSELMGLIGNLFLFQFVLQYPAMGPRLKKFQRRHFMLECICTCIMFINVQVRVRVWVRFKG